MNVTELRLGNYVYQIDRSNEIHLPVELPLEISKIGILSSEVDGLKINNIRPRDIRNFDLSPIPLSMKWLHKLGFSEFASPDRMRFEENGKSIMVSFAECRNVWQWQGIDLLSVHQLQNLFFALTGDELTIKEMSNAENIPYLGDAKRYIEHYGSVEKAINEVAALIKEKTWFPQTFDVQMDIHNLREISNRLNQIKHGRFK